MNHVLSQDPADRVFPRPEHEWVRIAAMVEPDWEALRRLPRSAPLPGERLGFNWQDIIDVSGSHQLDGVVRWRFLDSRLDEVCPDWVRDEAREYLAALRAATAGWAAAVAQVRAMLDARDVRHVVLGGAATYRLYGMGDEWPRLIDHVDIVTHPDEYEGAVAVAEALGRDPAVRGWSAPWDGVPCQGMSVSLFTIPPGYDYVHGECLWGRAFVESATAAPLLGGLRGPVPDPSRHFAALAYGVLSGLSFVPERLTVQNLARLYNLSRLPAFSWETVWAHLGVNPDADPPAFTFGPYRAAKLRQHPNPVLAADAALQPNCDEACGAAWTIETLAAVYPVPASAVAAARRILAAAEPYFPVLEAEEKYVAPHPAHWRGNPLREAPVRHAVCRWRHRPPVETMLFEETDPSADRRIEAGWWEVVARREQTFVGEDVLSTTAAVSEKHVISLPLDER